MPLPLSGLISLDMVATELAIPNTNLELGDIRIRTLASKLTGDISLSDLYGKSVVKSVKGEYKVQNATYGQYSSRDSQIIRKGTYETNRWATGSAQIFRDGVEQPIGSEIAGDALLAFGSRYGSNGWGGTGNVFTVSVLGNHSNITCQVTYQGRTTQSISAQVTKGSWDWIYGVPSDVTTWDFPYETWKPADNTPISFTLK